MTTTQHSNLTPFPPGVAYMDGEYLPVGEAKISILDNGFLHSDATYDVVHVWKGAFFRLDDHLKRFFQGMEKLHMTIPYSQSQIVEILHKCVALSGLQNAYVEFVCTRGVSPTLSRDPRDAVNRFFAFAIPFGAVANPEQMERGLHASIADIVRISPLSLDPTVKNYHWLDLVKGLYQAYSKGAETAILLGADGNISEGPGFNVFSIKNGRVCTPHYGVLMGVTRQTVFEICGAMAVECLACAVSPDELMRADEVFITSTAGGVMPVTKIDNMQIGSGAVGPLTMKIMEHYWQMHEEDCRRTAINYF